jgi:TP901 family phage tail tape measure protein
MALSLSGTGGNNALMGIQLHIGTQGVVTGATLANSSMQNIGKTARRTARNLDATTKAANDLGHAYLQASASMAAFGFAIRQVGTLIMNSFTKPIINAASQYEVAMSRVQFATNATEKEMASLDKTMIKVGLETIETPASAAEAFRALRTAGLETNEALALLPKTVQMVTGAAGMMGMDQAVRATVATVKKFQHTGASFTKLMDDIAQATRETALQWEDMPVFINALRDAPMRLQATTAEMLALGGVMKAGGMLAAQSGQAISIFANKLVTNSRKIQAVMAKGGISKEEFFAMDPKELRQRMIMLQKFGVDMFNAAGKLKPLKTILTEVITRSQELAKVSDEEALTTISGVFGEKAGAMIAMLQQLSEKGIDAGQAMNKLINSVDKSAGAMEKAEQAFLRTSEGVNKLIEGTQDTIKLILGGTILPIYSELLTLVKNVLNTFLTFAQQNPVFAKALSVTAIAVGLLATVFGTLILVLAGVMFYTQILGPALVGIGGPAAALALGIGALEAALAPLAVGLAVVVGAFVALYAAFRLFNHVMTTQTDGAAISIRNFFTDIKLIAQGVMEWWNGKGGPNSMKLFEQLDKRGLTGIVGALLQVKERVKSVFIGIWDGVKTVFTPVIAVVQGIWWAIGFLFDRLNSLFRLFSTSDIREQLPKWEAYGRIIGWVAGVILVGFIAKTVAATVAQAALGAIMLITNIKTIALVAAIVALGAAYVWAWNKADEFGENLGPAMFDAMDKALIYMAKLRLGVLDLGRKVSTWFAEGFSGGWDQFADWVSKQINFLYVKAKSVFGLASKEQVDKARAAAAGTAAFTPEFANDRIAELMVREFQGGTAGASGMRKEAMQKEVDYAIARSRGIELEAPNRSSIDYSPQSGGDRAYGYQGRNSKIENMTININGDVTRENAAYFANRVSDAMYSKMEQEWELGYSVMEE